MDHTGGGGGGTFELTATSSSFGETQKSNAPVNKERLISVQEEKELRRVFDFLCDYCAKTKLNDEIKELEQWISSTRSKQALAMSKPSPGVVTNSEKFEASLADSCGRIESLKQSIVALENKSDRKISMADITAMYKFLNQNSSFHR